MEAVTAIKMAIVYENDFVEANPLTPKANSRKKMIKKGPPACIFPCRAMMANTIRDNTAQPNNTLYVVFFFILQVLTP